MNLPNNGTRVKQAVEVVDSLIIAQIPAVMSAGSPRAPHFISFETLALFPQFVFPEDVSKIVVVLQGKEWQKLRRVAIPLPTIPWPS